jgi:hypothetical protein
MFNAPNLVALLGVAALGVAACQPHSQRPFQHGGPPPPAPPPAQPGTPEFVPPGGPAPVGVAPPMPTGNAPPPAASPRTEGTSKENGIATCGAHKSYEYIATAFKCADGSNPFNGDAYAASASRRGNVGASSTGHIIDLYDVPCPEGNQEVYVDMYAGCGPGESPWGS